jgi:hypothetical protein
MPFTPSLIATQETWPHIPKLRIRNSILSSQVSVLERACYVHGDTCRITFTRRSEELIKKLEKICQISKTPKINIAKNPEPFVFVSWFLKNIFLYSASFFFFFAS